jgi:hypothetical protein
VVISQKSIPARITNAYYLDRNADGIVETVVIKFNKKISLPDCVVTLDWGGANKTDSINVAQLAFKGSDSTCMEISSRGLFYDISLDHIKTSGTMFALVRFRSLPGTPANTAIVQDSAAPVIVSAQYIQGVNTLRDTLMIEFSEPILSTLSTSPFLLYSKDSSKSYTLLLDNVSLLDRGNARRYIVNQIQGFEFPQKGDSIWINPAGGIGDSTSAIQTNQANRRVVLIVRPSIGILSAAANTIHTFGCNGSSRSLRYTLPRKSFVSLKYFDVQGKQVASFISQTQNAGFYSLPLPLDTWARGIYIQVFMAGNFVKKDRVVVVR